MNWKIVEWEIGLFERIFGVVPKWRNALRFLNWKTHKRSNRRIFILLSLVCLGTSFFVSILRFDLSTFEKFSTYEKKCNNRMKLYWSSFIKKLFGREQCNWKEAFASFSNFLRNEANEQLFVLFARKVGKEWINSVMHRYWQMISD